MDATAVSSAPFCAMVAVPFPKGESPACCNLGKLARLEAAARTPKVTGAAATEGASARTSTIPSADGNRTRDSACPAASVTADGVESSAPEDASKVTATPTTG